MAFRAELSTTGVPDFGLIHIDPEETAKALQTYLDTASKLTGVSLNDISTSVTTVPQDPRTVTLTGLLERGMRLFDAIVWLSAGRPSSHPLQADPAMKKGDIPSMHEVARAVFYCYFMLVTQARYPAGRSASDKPKIPNFLRTIMGMEEEQHIYVERICTFEPQKFDPAWARYVSFANFGQEVLSRFGLGVAGYRSFGPFLLYQPKSGISTALANAVTFARSVASAPATWDIHPLTRRPDILKSRGNLNKNLGNLVLDVFDDDVIDEMVKAKVLYKKPEREPTHRNYLTWDPVDNISGNSVIFRQ